MLNTLQHTIQVMSDLYQEAPGRGINKSRQDKKCFPFILIENGYLSQIKSTDKLE